MITTFTPTTCTGDSNQGRAAGGPADKAIREGMEFSFHEFTIALAFVQLKSLRMGESQTGHPDLPLFIRGTNYPQVEEIAALVRHLCSDDAASITGACLSIDGGWTAR